MHNILDYLRAHTKKILGLGSLLSIGLVMLLVFSHDPHARKVIVVGMAVSYAAWGIVDHALHRDLNPIIALEYIAIAALSAYGVLFVLGWSF